MDKNKNKETLAFIEKAKAIYGDRFGYEDVYITKYTLYVKIRHSDHKFRIAPEDFLLGDGCPKCNKKKEHRIEKVKKSLGLKG